jgi:hypothetical protein
MYSYLSNDYNIVQLPFSGAFKDGFDRSVKLSPNLTLGEVFDASFHTDKSIFLQNGIPLHKNFLQVFELVRSYTKKPLYLGSLYRTYDWEQHRGRSGASQHLYGALDLNGQNVKEVITEAINTENELFQKLQDLGVTSFGEYNWGWHLDFREPKPSGEIYYWSKKKTNKVR